MFHESIEVVASTGEACRSVVDSDRSLVFRIVDAGTPERPPTYLLKWRDGQTLVEASSTEQKDPADGRSYYRIQIIHIGPSAIARLREKIEPAPGNPPASPEAIRSWAEEALLAFGGNGRDLAKPDGYNRVVHGDRELRLSDFGAYRLPPQLGANR